MFTLIALGTGVAWLYSMAAMLAPGVFPADFRDGHGMVAVYFEAAAVITVLALLGQVLELRARENTSGAIRALLRLAPHTARRITPEGDVDVPVDLVAWATCCACARVKACRSMVWWWKAARLWTRGW
jgi:Cu+-exporting ATPase